MTTAISSAIKAAVISPRESDAVRTAQRGEDSWHKNEDFKLEVPGAHPREDRRLY